jgi:hypothetical protein
MGCIVQRMAGLHAIPLHAPHRVGASGERKQAQADGSYHELRHSRFSTQNSDKQDMPLPSNKSTGNPENTVHRLMQSMMAMGNFCCRIKKGRVPILDLFS